MNEARRIREKMGLTQQQMAATLGVALRSVQNYESRDRLTPSVRLIYANAERAYDNVKDNPPPGPPARTQSEYEALEIRMDELQKRLKRVEDYVDKLSLALLGREKPEKYVKGGSGREDRDLPLGGYAI